MTSSIGPLADARQRVEAVRKSGLTIYDAVLPERSDLLFSDEELDELLSTDLVGRGLSGPIRTRSKLAKQLVAATLGYGDIINFRKTKPRFPGQDLDVYIQTNDNLQIWNQEISPERRYVLIRPSADGYVQAVRVVRGQQVAAWDKTGTLTSKFQAKRIDRRSGSTLVSPLDTTNFVEILKPKFVVAYGEIDSKGGTTINEIVVSTGADFFSEFVQFGGLVTNSKRQIRLPPDLFDSKS